MKCPKCEETIEKMNVLMKVTNEILDTIGDDRYKINDAVNWADLQCVSASIEMYRDQSWGWAVTIEEVSPTAEIFRKYIYDRLVARGYNVEVRTEW